jgi:hypothetical protein
MDERVISAGLRIARGEYVECITVLYNDELPLPALSSVWSQV